MKSSTPSASSLCVFALLLDDEEDIALPPRVTTTKSVFSTAFTVVDHPKARRRDIIIIESRCADALFRLDKKIHASSQQLLEIMCSRRRSSSEGNNNKGERQRERQRDKKKAEEEETDFCASLSVSLCLSQVVSLSPFVKRKKKRAVFFCALIFPKP